MKLGELLEERRKEFDSTLERRVYLEFKRMNVDIKIHFKVGVYEIDLALPDDKYAIEIDGKDYHSSEKQIARDIRKDAFLKKRNWKVKRYQGWLAHRHPDLPVCEYILRTMKNPTQEQKDLATGALVRVQLRTLDRNIGKNVAERYLRGRFE